MLVLSFSLNHYSDVLMSAMAFQIAGISIVCSTVRTGSDQRKHQNSASLVFVRGIHRASNAEKVSIWCRRLDGVANDDWMKMYNSIQVALGYPCFAHYYSYVMVKQPDFCLRVG